jgi:hypothetical protein
VTPGSIGGSHPGPKDPGGVSPKVGKFSEQVWGNSGERQHLPILEQVSGPEHPLTLAARVNFASWTGEAGDAAGARDQFAALLPTYVRGMGPRHPDTLAARAHLARWTWMAGDAAGARDQLATLLRIFERVLGPEHPDTQTIRGNLTHLIRVASSGRSHR